MPILLALNLNFWPGRLNGEERSGDLSEPHNRKMEAESQMMHLSSQLSMLQKQVEEEVELHGKSKNDSLLELTLEEKEQLSKQVTFFEGEVRGVRQTIDEIQLILHREGGHLSVKEHWAKDLHSKCADQSAQLEHLGKQVSMLGEYLERNLQLRNETDDRIDKEAQGRQKAETQLTNLSTALAITVSVVETEDISIEHHQHILVDQIKEAGKLRHSAEVSVLTLHTQIEQLEKVWDAAKNSAAVIKYQDKFVKQGLQTLVQLFLLALCLISLYSRVAEPPPLVPT